MAGKKNSNIDPGDITNMSAVITKLAQHSSVLAKGLNEAVASGKNLSKEMSKNMHRAIQMQVKDLQELQGKLQKYTKNITTLNEEEKKSLALMMKRENSMKASITSAQKYVDEMGHMGIATRLFGAEAVAAISSVEGALTMGLSVAISALVATFQFMVSVMTAGLSNLISLYNRWDEIMATTTRTMGDMARATGATGEQMTNLADLTGDLASTFSELGGSVLGIEEAGAYVTEFANAIRDTRLMTREMSADLLEMSRVAGISTEESVNLYRMLQSGGLGATQTTDDFTVSMEAFANSVHMTTGQVIRDYAGAADEVARFGRDGDAVFRSATLLASQYGFEVRQIFEAARGFSTFQQASQNVNELNAMFGTSISSFETMNEMLSDPGAGIAHLRQQIMDTGATWASMDAIQHQTLAEQMHLTEAQAMRVFEEGASYEQLMADQQRSADADAARAAMQEDSQERMHDLLMRTSTLWDTVGRQIELIANELSVTLAPIFSLIRDDMLNIAHAARDWITEMVESGQARTAIENVANTLHRVEIVTTNLISLGAQMSGVWEFLGGVWDGLAIAAGAFHTMLLEILPTLNTIETMLGGLGLSGGLSGLSEWLTTDHSPESAGGGAHGADHAHIYDSVIRQAVGLEGATPESAAAALRQQLGSRDAALIEAEQGQSLEQYVAGMSPEKGGDTGAETATSATATAPATARTTASAPSRASAGGGAVQVVRVTGDVTLDGQSVGRVLYHQSAT